jgi:hypothetical protein
MFATSIFATPEKLKAFLDKPSLKTLQKDPAFIAAKSVSATRSKLQKDLAGFLPTFPGDSVSILPA